MTTFSDYNPAGTSRTTKKGIARHVPLLPDHFNHKWFEAYVEDFLSKNELEKDGVNSGCVISQDGGDDSINMTAGEVYINGVKHAVADPGTFPCPDDGWYAVYIDNTETVFYGFLNNETVQGAQTPDDSVIVGFAVRGNGVFYITSFFNESNEEQHIRPTVIAGPSLSNTRVTDLETTFVSSLSEGDKLLFLGSTILTANRILTTEVEAWMDGPDEKLDLDTFDLTFVEVSGKISVTTDTGKIILNGKTHGLVIIGDVIVEQGENFSGSYVLNGVAYSNGVYSDFATKNLIINVQSNTTVDVDSDNIIFVDNQGGGKRIDDIDTTFTMPTDLESGTSEKLSTWYGIWLDSDLNQRLVPDLESAADGTTAGKLIDSGATFLTDLVKTGDIIYNLTDRTQTTASSDATLEGEVSLIDDIFVSGEDYKIVKMSPEGLGTNRNRIGAAFNNSSSNFDDSTYAQGKAAKLYTTGLGDYTVSNITSGGNESSMVVAQDGIGWFADVEIGGSVTLTASDTILFSFSGVTWGSTALAVSTLAQSALLAGEFYSAQTVATSDVSFEFQQAVTLSHAFSFDGRVRFSKKPTFVL